MYIYIYIYIRIYTVYQCSGANMHCILVQWGEPERALGSTAQSGVQTAVSATSAHRGHQNSHDTVILLLWSIITTSQFISTQYCNYHWIVHGANYYYAITSLICQVQCKYTCQVDIVCTCTWLASQLCTLQSPARHYADVNDLCKLCTNVRNVRIYRQDQQHYIVLIPHQARNHICTTTKIDSTMVYTKLKSVVSHPVSPTAQIFMAHVIRLDELLCMLINLQLLIARPAAPLEEMISS